MQPDFQGTEIAIIGTALRVPGARTAAEMWAKVAGGVDCVSWFSRDELLAAGLEATLIDRPNFVPAHGAIPDIDRFDAEFFGYSPREAEILDPQQRLLLEAAWHALEDAGYARLQNEELVGVFAGGGISTYWTSNLLPNRSIMETAGLQVGLGNDKDYLATRVGYKLDLRGPCVTVQTACSTSLVAVHLACQSLLSGECTLALAGGVSINARQVAGYLYSEGGAASPDGRCRAFDALASGMVGGSGLGLVVLKRYEQALADGDSIVAIIRGSAINNDGAGRVGFTAPSIAGQATVIAEALAVAGVDPATISLVEAHGTGTPLGDPIEIAALTRAYRRSTERRAYCAIGSVKTNLGHLDTAAGVIGLIKAALALKHRELPPSLHFESPNPRIDFDNSPFYVNTTLKPWPDGDTPRRAAVSSFGLGGTNAHMVLEEAAPVAVAVAGDRASWDVVMLSARTATALEQQRSALRESLVTSASAVRLLDVCHTLAAGRRAFPHRLAIVARDLDEAVAALDVAEPPSAAVFTGRGSGRQVAFMFPGQGSQHPGMGAALYRAGGRFRVELDACAEALVGHLGMDIRDLLYGPSADVAEAATRLTRTEFAQPVLFAVEYALACQAIADGFAPTALIGHSIGEYVAACLAGVFSRDDALALVASRGRMIQQLPGGGMLAVFAPADDVAVSLAPDISLAAVNGPRFCTVAGTYEAIAATAERLADRGIRVQPLHTSHAFHSAMLDSILGEFTAQVARFDRQAPRLPIVSNLSGTWLTPEEAVAPSYWANHLRATVRFHQGIETLLGQAEGPVLLEVGPGRTLCTFARDVAGPSGPPTAISLMPDVRENADDARSYAIARARAWTAGAEATPPRTRGDAKRVPLPTYPFERRRFWVEREAGEVVGPERRPLGDWFHAPIWQQSPRPARRGLERPSQPVEGPWLVLDDGSDVGAKLKNRLRAAGRTLLHLRAGDADDRERLEDLLQDVSPGPLNVVYLRALACDGEAPALAALAADEERCFQGILRLAQVLASRAPGSSARVVVATDRLFSLADEPTSRPAQALALGPAQVVPIEHREIALRVVDFDLRSESARHAAVEQLLEELGNPTPGPLAAWRGGQRWERRFVPVGAPVAAGPRLRPNGTYLITGGLGGIGLVLAGHLADNSGARLVLVGRSPVPARDTWPDLVADPKTAPRTRATLERLLELESRGAEVLVLEADVTNLATMTAAIDTAEARFGPIHGVIHAAGVAGGGLVQIKRPQDAAAVLAPKTVGATVLDQAFACRPLDFFVVCSALTAVIGGVGQVDYCAANAFLDAFVADRAARRPEAHLSIDWAAWRDVGMAVDTALPPELRAARTRQLADALTSAEGAECFMRALGSGYLQMVISPTDLERQQDHLRSFDMSTALAALSESRVDDPSHGRPEMATAYVAPGNALERAVAAIWCQHLGIADIGVNDDFFELGGHSLIAVQMVAQLNEAFDLRFPVRRLFEAPTVSGMVQALAADPIERPRLEGVAEIMLEVAALSEDDVAALVGESGGARG